MKKRTKFLGIFLLIIVLFSLTIGFTAGYNDTDDDGIDDSFEALNRREIDINIEANGILIESVRKSDKKKDMIMANILYDTKGIRFQFGYKPDLEENFALLFNISFRELIEFVDIDIDGIYNPEIDQKIQNYSLIDFSLVFYENSTCLSGSVLHHFKLQTANETFIIDIYFAEEFTLVENSLLLPTQAKIDIKIANFTYLNSSSQLALYSRLDSEIGYEEQHYTEDERNNYAENEEGVITAIEDYIGFYTWSENAIVDDVSKNILISEIMPDVQPEYGQKIYLNYPRGALIEHNYKIGIEGLLISEKVSLLPLIVLVLILGALSIITIYSVYHVRVREKPFKIRKREGEEEYLQFFEEDEYDPLFDSRLALQILEGEDAIDRLYHKGEINITFVSADFDEIINQINFEEFEKRDFIKEMLSLTPHERELILSEMKKESQY
ncbi:MAG: hypothetical protein JSV62_12810 [Promethearchaeota archaeon]|nr:MAG: hypothetical protein JSV62_12810 [Candidatus Lokiarchaeota archaeon]